MECNGYSPESLYRMILEPAPLAAIAAGRDGRILLWNTGAEQIFGWSRAEALGQSMDLFIPEKHRLSHWEGYARVIESGLTRYASSLLTVPALTKDGRRISVEFSVSLLRNAQGEIFAIAALLQDVTARWEKEKQLRQRLAEAEAAAQAPRAGTPA